MKRFLLFLVIAIAVVSLGLTIYYFSTDNEVIYIKSSYLVINQYDNIRTVDGNNDLVDFKNRSEYTTLSYSIEQSEDVLEYNEKEGYFTAKIGGESKIIISTNNMSYSRLVVDVLVCDGSEQYPFMLRTEEDLKKIGNDDTYTTEKSYKLGNDIELTEDWTPIANYSGTFDGNFFTIKNMTINDESLASTVETNAGFVSVLKNNAVIKNLILSNMSIDASVEYMGAFAGTNNGLIQTSEAEGIIKNNTTSTVAYTGGVAGRNIYIESRAKLDRCGFSGSIILAGSQQVAGGVVGQNQGGIISETYSRSKVLNGSSKFGGIVGYNEATSNATADLYDSYFYMTEKDSQTNYENIGGVTYKNSEYTTRNSVAGNYYGGIFTKSEVENNTVEGSFKFNNVNGYLISELVAGSSDIEFINKSKFVNTKETKANKQNRLWNFDTVWEIPNIAKYPILNIYSSVGSDYVVDNLPSEDDDYNLIETAQDLYDAIAENNSTKPYKIVNDIPMDANNNFVWGDEDHPIPETFDGTIVNPDGYKIEHLTIENKNSKQNVGLVKTIGSNAVLDGLYISDVTITGLLGMYVGVIAGQSQGATISNTIIEQVNVNISGYAFGTYFGRATSYEGHGLKGVTAKIINASNVYYYYAGGLVGINLGTITTDTDVYNNVYNVSFVANFAGGIAGANGGKISYTTAQSISFKLAKKNVSSEITPQNVYSGEFNIFVGGAVGVNEYAISTTTTVRGTISNVYASIETSIDTGRDYVVYVGGIAGYNTNYISRAYVTRSNLTVSGSHGTFVGGVVGYNSGRILNSVVDKNTKILTQIVSSVGTVTNNNTYVLNTSNCSIVGGIAGYDAQTSNSTCSIFQSASYASQIKGYYAGGLVGISYGRVEQSFCGETTKTNGGVSITGYMSGGLAAVVGGGYIRYCYSVCALNSSSYKGTYTSSLSAIKMEVSCMAGLTVFVLNRNTIVECCYAVVSFNGTGASFGSCADISNYSRGTLRYCAYQTIGTQKSSQGTQVSVDCFNGADGYYAFRNAMYTLTVWDLDGTSYPTLEGVNVRFPNSSVPNFN